MNSKNLYTYRIEWSTEDECFIAKVLEFPSLSAFGDTREVAQRELDIVIDHTLEWMEEEKESIPDPLSLKDYKGNIALRIPPDTHRSIAYLANEEGVSTNQFITSILERNMHYNSINTLLHNYEHKLEEQFENIKKLTLFNIGLYQKMLLLNDSTINTDFDQNYIYDTHETITNSQGPLSI